MKMCVGKKWKTGLAMALLCAMLLCGNASSGSTAPPVQSTAGISAALDWHSAGDTVKVELVRSGKQTAVNITLAEKGPE